MDEQVDAVLKKWRESCHIHPYPRKTYHPFRGTLRAEGQLVSSFHALQAANNHIRWGNWSMFHAHTVFHIDCIFEPYGEDHIVMSIDMFPFCENQSEPGKDPCRQMAVMSLSTKKMVHHFPFERALSARSTALSPDGRYLAWPSGCEHKIYDRVEHSIEGKSRFYLCSTFSPCSTKIAMLWCSGTNFLIDIIDLAINEYVHRFEVVGTLWVYTSQCQNYHIQWSRCGKYIGVTYRGGFKVIHVTPEGCTQIIITPINVEYLATLSRPRAFDFRCIEGERHIAVAFSSRLNETFLFGCGPRGLTRQIARRPPPAENRPLAVNCVRFSNDQDLVAVAFSTGQIYLLSAEALELLLMLEKVTLQPRPPPCIGGFTSISFSFNDRFLVTGADDGWVRVWCLHRRVSSLRDLCRTAIRASCTMDNMRHLHMPIMLQKYLKENSF